ncbi:uncharacterized protein [Macaca fascicularis]|uniref:uncharacterized protein n=1 Tax=Macaca fascicularis TaxID=9541 RepID=UPI0032B054B6
MAGAQVAETSTGLQKHDAELLCFLLGPRREAALPRKQCAVKSPQGRHKETLLVLTRSAGEERASDETALEGVLWHQYNVLCSTLEMDLKHLCKSSIINYVNMLHHKPLEKCIKTTGRQRFTPAAGRQSFTPAAGRHRFTPAAGRHRFTPAAGRHRFTPAAGRHRFTPAAGRQRFTPAAGRHRFTPAAGRHRFTPAAGRHRFTPTGCACRRVTPLYARHRETPLYTHRIRPPQGDSGLHPRDTAATGRYHFTPSRMEKISTWKHNIKE